MPDLRMPLDDVVTLKTGAKFSETWFEEVWKKLFRPRKCDRCGEVKDTLGAFIRGTSKYATDLVFGYPQDIAEKIIVILELDALCEPCFIKRRYNGSGPPPFRIAQIPEPRRTQ